VHLATDIKYGITANNSFEILHNIVDNMESLDKEIRKFASPFIKSLENEWSKDSTKEIANKTFMKRMILSDIDVNRGGRNFYLHDNNITIFVTMTTDYKCVNVAIVE